MTARTIVSAMVLLVSPLAWGSSCGLSGSGDQVAPDDGRDGPILQETGNCQNENVEGTCTFLVASRAPSQPSAAPPGTTLYRIEHQIAVKGEERTINLTSAYLRIPDESADQLREHYRKNSPTPCSAYIVRPPCNPDATSVSLGVGPPEFAKPERY